MIDQRTMELIHGELDGMNSSLEQAELQRLLEASIEAREYRSQMQMLFSVMRAVPAKQTAPPGLRERILRAIPYPPPSGRATLSARSIGSLIENIIHQYFPTPQSGVTPMKKKFVIAFAAIAVIGVIVYAIIAPWPPKEDTQGTIGAAKKYRSEQVNDKDVVLEPNKAATTGSGANQSSTETPTGALPTANKSNQPTNATPTANKSNQPTNATPTANKSNQPTNATPTANKSNQPTNATPTANKSNQPTNAQPTANKSTLPTNATVSANKTTLPTNMKTGNKTTLPANAKQGVDNNKATVPTQNKPGGGND